MILFYFPLIYRQPIPSWTHWSNPSSSKGFLSCITLRNSPSYSLSHAPTIPKNSILHRLPWPIFCFLCLFFSLLLLLLQMCQRCVWFCHQMFFFLGYQSSLFTQNITLKC
jgi:hypothetical protein